MENIIIGFTGTQEGMTEEQFQIVLSLVNIYNPSSVHHGDCIGADYQFHEIVSYHANNRTFITIHPPEDSSKRAFCRGYELILKPKPYLDRNRDIVDRSTILIAAPKSKEVLRSGTWATIRYARKINRPHIIVMP